MGCWGQVRLSFVNYEISFTAHSSYNNCICNVIVANYFISKAMAFGSMTLFVPNKGLNICI